MGEINFAKLREIANAEGDEAVEVLPAGDYNVVLRSAKVKKTSTGKDMLSLFFRVTDGPYKENGKLFTNVVISPESPKALAIALQQLTVLGASSVMEREGTLEEVATAITGSTATVTAAVTSYKDEPRNEIKSIRNGTPVAQADDSVFGGTTFAPTGTDPF